MTELTEPIEGVDEQTDEPLPEIESTPVEVTSDMSLICDLVFRAYPDVVPELIEGDSISEILASVEPAKTAYRRIADQLRQELLDESNRDSSAPVNVDPTPLFNPEKLTTAERLRFGLKERQRETTG